LRFKITNGSFQTELELKQVNDHWIMVNGDRELEVDVAVLSPNVFSLRLGGHSLLLTREGQNSFTTTGKVFQLKVEDDLQLMLKELGWDRLKNKQTGKVVAQIPGLIIKLKHQVGDKIQQGEPLLIMEAMKMENEIKAPCDGIIAAIHVQEGQTVEKGTPLVDIK